MSALRWTDAAVSAALGLETVRGAEDVEYAGVATDTRLLTPGALFVALRGENHDGHAFLVNAAARGARGVVVDHVPADVPPELRLHVVPDTLIALGQLARFHRRRSAFRVCAITGTNGKTTTKELLRVVLSTRYRTHATQGNFNNLVGAPLTLLSAPPDAEVVIAELGTNAPGEIARLAGIVEPDAAIITGVTAGHLEGLGSIEGVLREKTSLLSWLPPGAPAVVADEPSALAERARTLSDHVIVAGSHAASDASFRARDVSLDDRGRVRFHWSGGEVRLELRGRHNARNALLALALGSAWGVDPAEAGAALAQLPPPKLRAEFHDYGSLTVIADCYNANPGSVEAAVDLLAALPARSGRIVVLGSMLELGAESAQLHQAAARSIAARGFDRIVATGAFTEAFAEHDTVLGERLIRERDPFAAWDRLEPLLHGGEVVLLKGSRGVALERLLPRFEQWGSLRPHGEAFGSRVGRPAAGARGETPPEEHPQKSAGATNVAPGTEG